MPPLSPYRHTSLSIPDGETYRCQAFNGRGEPLLGVTLKADRALSVRVAYGRLGTHTAADEGVASVASLPFATDAQTFSSSSGAESGVYKEFEVPPHATLLQLVISNSSGATASVASVDYDFDALTVSEEDSR